MSYLDDPRVFYAIERTLLAWIRTEIAILAFAFLLKRFGTFEQGQGLEVALNVALGFLCILVVVMSVLSLVQCYFSISKLGPTEVPNRMAKYFVFMTGAVGIVICSVSSLMLFLI
jgi:putative membrane protein